jgi:hypothetical protein
MGELLQQLRTEWRWPTQLSVALQQLPLISAHLQPPTEIPIGSGWIRACAGHLFLQSVEAELQLGLAPGQTYGGGLISQVMENGAPDMGAGKGRKGGLTGGVEQLGRSDQAQQSHLKQIVLGFGAASPIVMGQRRHQVAMGLYQGIAALQRQGGRRLMAVLGSLWTGGETGAGVHGSACSKGVAPERSVPGHNGGGTFALLQISASERG